MADSEITRRMAEEPTKRIFRFGDYALNREEEERLRIETAAGFIPHPSLHGVEMRPIAVGLLPNAIAGIISALQGKLRSFSAIRMGARIPKHKHRDDGEIYFGAGGEGITVTLFGRHGEEIGDFKIGKISFAVTLPGETHAAAGEPGTTFFSAKFVTSE